jgi:hypothetical protein
LRTIARNAIHSPELSAERFSYDPGLQLLSLGLQ